MSRVRLRNGCDDAIEEGVPRARGQRRELIALGFTFEPLAVEPTDAGARGLRAAFRFALQEVPEELALILFIEKRGPDVPVIPSARIARLSREGRMNEIAFQQDGGACLEMIGNHGFEPRRHDLANGKPLFHDFAG